MYDDDNDLSGHHEFCDHSNQRFEHLLPDMSPLEQMCRRIEAVVNENGWDQKPRFYVLSMFSDTSGFNQEKLREMTVGEGEQIAALGLHEIPMPDFCYEEPAMGLTVLLKGLAEMEDAGGEQKRDLVRLMNKMVPSNFFGFGVICEAWALPKNVVSEEEAERVARERTIDEHPDRVELRDLTFMTIEGRMGHIMRERGGFPEYEELDQPDVSGARIPTAVQVFTKVFQGFDEFRKKVGARLDDPGLN